jgi:uncharacterized protein YoxC
MKSSMSHIKTQLKISPVLEEIEDRVSGLEDNVDVLKHVNKDIEKKEMKEVQTALKD